MNLPLQMRAVIRDRQVSSACRRLGSTGEVLPAADCAHLTATKDPIHATDVWVCHDPDHEGFFYSQRKWPGCHS